MQDVSGGKERVRKWPRSRGKPRSTAQKENQEFFGNVQRSARYLAPQISKLLLEMTARSPLLPRDIITSLAYNQFCNFVSVDGKVRYPLADKIAVSEALDTITQTPGKSLVRGPKFWEESDGGGGFNLDVLFNEQLYVATPEVILTDLQDYKLFFVAYQGVGATANGFRAVQVSTDNGASWINTGSKYAYATNNGQITGRNEIPANWTQTTAARIGLLLIGPSVDGINPPFALLNGERGGYIDTGLAQINALRMYNEVGNLSGGRLTVIGLG